MAWGQNSKQPQPEADDAARSQRSRYAAPPTCPRCELTKSQMNRTIQNYQKAYRKKVEGLKQELTTVRSDNQHLRSQVRRLRRKRWVHAPSMLVGAAVCFGVMKALQRLRSTKQQNKEQPEQSQPNSATPAEIASTNGTADSCIGVPANN